MGGIGSGELLLILLVAFIVVGPKDLPKLARRLGKAVKSLRRILSELTEAVDLEEKEESENLTSDDKGG
ncbi:MAG: twin-arginine translocase TatA/TatE family subunit [Lachnospiraceae bacterium]|nr:twin-arginine translocase TatA/TatE family subunit [Lachnospiraceae bacterium]